DRYLAAGDTVVAEGRFSATASNTGFRMEIPIAHVFTVRDGKITSWRGYGDTAASLAAHTGKAVSA
ncbi:MAG TPA: nuclear transport factor 2 family protein, partial [Bryobacteraceae bacterium]|nr:nuclear transport factor 2 family protein [Bryobacteraceae bacterium]